jgi:hypothetical protein
VKCHGAASAVHRCAGAAIGAYDERIEHQLLHRTLEDLLFNALLDDEPIDSHWPLLPNAMCAILGLDVRLQSSPIDRLDDAYCGTLYTALSAS